MFGAIMIAGMWITPEPTKGFLKAWTVFGELVLGGILLFRLAKRAKPPAKPKPAKEQIVTACLAVPTASPDAGKAYGALLPYCPHLLQRRLTPGS